MKSTWDASNAVRQSLDHLNAAWRENRFADLPPFFDEDIITKGPGLQTITRGRVALVNSYIDFMGKWVITAYEESNHVIDVNQSSACASYDWSMSWEQSGKRESASGHEMFVFELRNGQWIAVLRVILF